MQALPDRGGRELSGDFGWLGYAVRTEGLDRIIVFIISSIYLTVISKLLHAVVGILEVVSATFECFLERTKMDACHMVGMRTMAAENDD